MACPKEDKLVVLDEYFFQAEITHDKQMVQDEDDQTIKRKQLAVS